MKFKILYFLSKLHGLSPFQYNWMSKTALPSNSSKIYCIVHATLFSVLAASCEYFLFLTIPYGNLNLVAHIVDHIEIVSTSLKFCFIIFFQIIHRRRLIMIVNRVVALNRKVLELCSGEDLIYDDAGLCRLVEQKLYVSIIQLMAFFYSISNFMLHKNMEPIEYFTYFMGLYVQIVPMLVTSYYYCGLVLHCLQYFRIMNDKLSGSEKQLRRRKIVGEDLEKMSLIFENICSLCQNINETFGFQMTFYLLNTFFMSLSAVKLSFSAL